MFDRDSRYAQTPRIESDARTGTRPRAIVTLPGVIEHTVTRQDRLDRLAAHYYNDPRKWWRILDANPQITFGGDLDLGRYDGTIIVIPADGTRGGP